MREILILGAGHSAPCLIRDLLQHAAALDARVTVADLDADVAARRLGGHPRGRAVAFDVDDVDARRREIAAADVVVHLLPPRFQPLVAKECVAFGSHLVSASYMAPQVEALDGAAREAGVTLLCEMGLDPGIDVMAAEALIARIHAAGGEVERFCSYGGGLPEPEPEVNPLRYCITWNPRNVVMAAAGGACYQRGGALHLVPWERVFTTHWPVEVPGLGTLEAYANRDSLAYRQVHRIDSARTVVRGTLRYPGWCDSWSQIVRLGLPNEELEIPDFARFTWRELVAMCLPDREIVRDGPGAELPEGDVRGRVAAFLGVEPGDPGLEKLAWLGLFSDQPLGGATPAAALVELLKRKLTLPAGVRDLVVLHQELVARYPTKRRERVTSTFLHYGDPSGEPGGVSAMARGVGQPMALAVRFLLAERITCRGALIPTLPEVYQPVLAALEASGMGFQELTETLPDDVSDDVSSI